MVYYADIENKALHDLRQLDAAITPDFDGQIDARALFELLNYGGSKIFYSSMGDVCMLLQLQYFI